MSPIDSYIEGITRRARAYNVDVEFITLTPDRLIMMVSKPLSHLTRSHSKNLTVTSGLSPKMIIVTVTPSPKTPSGKTILMTSRQERRDHLRECEAVQQGITSVKTYRRLGQPLAKKSGYTLNWIVKEERKNAPKMMVSSSGAYIRR